MSGVDKKTIVKFDWDDPNAMSVGVCVLEKAYKSWQSGRKKKLEAIEEAMRPYRNKKVRMPNDESLRDALREIDAQKKDGKLKEDAQRKSARTWVINEVLKRMGIEEEKEPEPEQIPGQMEMDLTPEPEKKPEKSDSTKMMRFLAGQVGEIVKALNAITEELKKLNGGDGDEK